MSIETASVLQRLRHGLGAQAFGQVTNTFIRLSEVPLFLTFWGVERYGEWLMISAIPAYLAITDGGFTGAARQEMTMCMGAGNRAGALETFQSTWVLLLILSAVLLGATFVAVLLLPLDQWLNLWIISGESLATMLVLLAIHVLLSFQCGLLYGGYSCMGRYPRGTVLATLMYLSDFLGLAVAVILGGGFVAAAAGYLAGRMVGLALFVVDVRRVAPWLRYGWAQASRKRLAKLVRPSLASMMIPLAEGLNLQGMRLAVGLVLGPAAVALFASMRTLSRTAVQSITIIAYITEPEIALAFGAGHQDRLNRLFLRSSQVTLWSAIIICVVLGLIGEWLFGLWTRGQIGFDLILLGWLLLAAAARSLWFTALMVPYATNRHERPALALVAVYGTMIVVAWSLMPHYGVKGAGAAVFFAELAMAATVLPTALRMTGMAPSHWARTIIRPPFSAAIRALKGDAP